jgi:hypothetical protein
MDVVQSREVGRPAFSGAITELEKTVHRYSIAVKVAMLVVVVGCSGDGGDSPPLDEDPLTPEEQQLLSESYTSLAAEARAALLTESPMTALAEMLPACMADPVVEEAWLTDCELWVRYRRGGTVSWYAPPPESTPEEYSGSGSPMPEEKLVVHGLEPVGNLQACVINQQYLDESRPHSREVANSVTSVLTLHGYDVSVIDGEMADLDFFASGFDDYSVIFDISHGSYDGEHTWLATGEEGGIWELLTQHWSDWRNGRVSLKSIAEVRAGETVDIDIYAVSELYFADRYEAGVFPHSLIYLVACQSFKGSTQLAAALNTAGAAVTIGWDESNCLGQSTGLRLIQGLMSGADLETAFGALPQEAIHDDCVADPGANLVYHPDSGGSLYLTEPASACSLVVDPDPDSIAPSWIVTGPGEYLMSGTGDVSISDLSPGDYHVVWGDVPGWMTPRDVSIVLDVGESYAVQGIYTCELRVITLLANMNYVDSIWIKNGDIIILEAGGHSTVWGGRDALYSYSLATGVRATMLDDYDKPYTSVVVGANGMIYLGYYRNMLPGSLGGIDSFDPGTGQIASFADAHVAVIDMVVDDDDNLLVLGNSDAPGDPGMIMYPHLDNHSPRVIRTGMGRVWSVAYADSAIYYTRIYSESTGLWRYGESGDDLICSSVIMSIAVSGDYIYYCDFYEGTIRRIGIDGANNVILAEGLNKPNVIRFDETSHRLFAADIGTSESHYTDGRLFEIVGFD